MISQILLLQICSSPPCKYLYVRLLEHPESATTFHLRRWTVSIVLELWDFDESTLLLTQGLIIVHFPLDPSIVGLFCSDLMTHISDLLLCAFLLSRIWSDDPYFLLCSWSTGVMLLLLSFVTFFPYLEYFQCFKCYDLWFFYELCDFESRLRSRNAIPPELW
jgi:hypothetical protein